MHRAANFRRAALVGLSLSLFCSAIVSATPSAARPTTGITVSPTSQALTLGPGLLQAHTVVSLKNNSKYPFTATLKPVDFKALDEYGNISLGQAGIPLNKYGLANYLTLPGGSIVNLQPGQSINADVLIQNRADLTPGGHYGAVVVSSTSAATGSNNVNFNQDIVSLLFVKKLGGINYGLQLQSLDANRGNSLPDTVTMRFRSTGNVYVTPRGYVTLSDPAGKLVAKGIINEASITILQDTSRQLVTLLTPVANSSKAGRYKITAYYHYEGQTGFQTKSIYVMRGALSPKAALILGLTGVVVFILIVRRMHRRAYSIR